MPELDPATPARAEGTRPFYEVSGVIGESRNPDGPHIAETLLDYDSEDGLVELESDEVDGLGVSLVEVTAYGDDYKSLFLKVCGFDRDKTKARWGWIADRLTAANIRDTFWEGQRAKS